MQISRFILYVQDLLGLLIFASFFREDKPF